MNALQLLAMNMTTSFTVEATIERSQQNAYFRHSVVHAVRLVGGVAILIIIFAPFLLLIFGPRYAEEGTKLLRLLTLGSLPNVIIWLYLGMARVQNQTSGINLVQGILCMLVIGGSYWLLPFYGINSVGLVWLISQTVVAGVLLTTKLKSILIASSS
jgi:O-antigen/teichoic acid export membrane protein